MRVTQTSSPLPSLRPPHMPPSCLPLTATRSPAQSKRIRRASSLWDTSSLLASLPARFTSPIPRLPTSRRSGDSIGQEYEMNPAFAQIALPFNFSWLQQMDVVNGAVGRLLVACCLGGLIGLVREASHKAAGVRTNLLICMGASFFTLLSPVLAGESGSNRGQVASNIV